MTERKVLNKYYPPDYDPSKIPRMKKGEYNRKWVQRVMAPFNMQCNTCSEYIYKGKKFNMRREMVTDEEYLGIKIWRFYFRCPKCLAEISFKTDLINCDYAAEHGSTRLFEAARITALKVKEERAKEEQEAQDPMKMLEKRTKMSRQEMEELAALEELRDSNKKQARVDFEAMIGRYREEERLELVKQEEEDEDLVRQVFGRDESDVKIKRILEDDDEDTSVPSTSACFAVKREVKEESSTTTAARPSQSKQRKLLAGIVKKPKQNVDGEPPRKKLAIQADAGLTEPISTANCYHQASGPSASGASALGIAPTTVAAGGDASASNNSRATIECTKPGNTISNLVGDYGSSSDDD